jgi:hypothetical protein
MSEGALQWILYEQMKIYLAKKETLALSTSDDEGYWNISRAWGGKIGAAGGAKLVAAIVTYPHEVTTLFILRGLELC